jgi:hypothetical protein
MSTGLGEATFSPSTPCCPDMLQISCPRLYPPFAMVGLSKIVLTCHRNSPTLAPTRHHAAVRRWSYTVPQNPTAAMSRSASQEDTNEEEEHDTPSVFRPSRPACTTSPIAVPGAAQLLIPLPGLPSGRGLSLPHDHPMALAHMACLCSRAPAQSWRAPVLKTEDARAERPCAHRPSEWLCFARGQASSRTWSGSRGA